MSLSDVIPDTSYRLYGLTEFPPTMVIGWFRRDENDEFSTLLHTDGTGNCEVCGSRYCIHMEKIAEFMKAGVALPDPLEFRRLFK